jgi:SPP1 family predicted phage head-tail adaptor
MSPRPIPLRLLNTTATIGRVSRADDSQGGFTRTYPSLYTDVRCRIRPLSTPERTVAEREEVDATHRIYFLPDQDVQRGDRVTISGVEYDVVFPRQPSEPDHHQEVDVREQHLGA